MVSHDRYLLDECVDHIGYNLIQYSMFKSGNFSDWMRNFENNNNLSEMKNELLKKEIVRMKESSKQSEIGPIR